MDPRVVHGVNWTSAPPAPETNPFFMELLQSATISGTANPTNTRTYWNETSYGIEDFDRIRSRSLYIQTPLIILLTIIWMEGYPPPHMEMVHRLLFKFRVWTQILLLTNWLLPSSWTQQTFQFTTGPTTNRIAILLSAYAPGSNVAILVGIVLSPQVSINCDVDGDSKGNGIDIDSDNDGIYDVKAVSKVMIPTVMG